MSNWKLNLLFGLFVGLLVGMNLLGGKITTIFGISVSVAIFMTPLTFLITDMVAEVYGRKIVNQFIFTGVVTLLVIFAYTILFVNLQPNERYAFNEEYSTIFGSSLRIIVASVAAFALSQLHDLWAYEFWKKKTGGKLLWLRNNLSTMVSQFIDTFAFMMIAFYMVTPQFDFWFILQLVIPYYLFKVLFAALDTPLVYLGVRWLRGGNEKDLGISKPHQT